MFLFLYRRMLKINEIRVDFFVTPLNILTLTTFLAKKRNIFLYKLFFSIECSIFAPVKIIFSKEKNF